LLWLVSQVVIRVDEFETQWTNGRYLADIFTGFCPMKVVRVTRQNADTAGRISLKLVGVEPITQANVENTGDNCVDAVLGVFVRHELYPRGDLDPDRVGPGLCWIANKGGVVHPGGKPGYGFQVIPSGRTDLNFASPGWWFGLRMCLLLIFRSLPTWC
jgi:hypothetical protein